MSTPEIESAPRPVRIGPTTMATTSSSTGKQSRQRVPASERRAALIEAAVHEFAKGGLHGTPVDRIARRVGVAQPYVFSLFPNKRELFLAAVERGFELIAETFTRAAQAFDPALAAPDADVLTAMGQEYMQVLETDRDYLMLQHQAYAACDDEVIRDRVRALYAGLVAHVERLSGADAERIDEFFRYGMWLNVAAAMGVEDLSVGCEWMREEFRDADRHADRDAATPAD
jgi:AcrR family transcriptional regulator